MTTLDELVRVVPYRQIVLARSDGPAETSSEPRSGSIDLIPRS